MKIYDFRDKSHNYTLIQYHYIYKHRSEVLNGARVCLLEIPISKSDTLTITPHKVVLMGEQISLFRLHSMCHITTRERGVLCVCSLKIECAF